MHIARTATVVAAFAGAASLWACAPAGKQAERVYPAWGFAVAFPAEPRITERPASAANNGVRSFSAETKGPDLYLAAIAFDIASSDKSADQIMSEVGQAMAKGGTLTQTYTATGKTLGREVLIETPGQASIRMRLFVAGKRLYEVGGQSPLGAKDARITRFMDSFRLLPDEPRAGLAPG
jgi:hypothetical protein